MGSIVWIRLLARLDQVSRRRVLLRPAITTHEAHHTRTDRHTVSRICLGCLSFESPEWRGWVLGENGNRTIVERAIDFRGSLFDATDIFTG